MPSREEEKSPLWWVKIALVIQFLLKDVKNKRVPTLSFFIISAQAVEQSLA